MKKLLLLVSAFLFVAVTSLHATQIYSVEDYAISGSDMAGMRVTVEVEDGNETTETKTWEATTGNNGRAKKEDSWELNFNGPNTWFSNDLDDLVDEPGRDVYWEFSSTVDVKSFTIDAIAGNIVFDIFAIWTDDWSPTNYGNSEGSGDGWWQENSYTDAKTTNKGDDDDLGFEWEFDTPIAVGSETPARTRYGDTFLYFSFLMARPACLYSFRERLKLIKP